MEVHVLLAAPMKLSSSVAPRYVPAFLALLMPVILVYSSVRTFRELDQMQAVFLRNRSAAIAARLETLSGTSPQEIESLVENEPGLIAVRVFSQPGDAALAELWDGRELFRTQTVSEGSIRVFRAFIPFHGGGQLRIAQIDVDAGSADFLLVHARHNVVIASVSSGVIILLAAYALWSMRRIAAEEKRHLELAHFAHLGKMSAVLAHEIRTPLATIKGFTQLALEQTDGSVRSMLEPVVDEAQRLERLVSDLLLYGRPPRPVRRECSWDEFASSLPILSPYVTFQSATFRFRTDPDLLRHVLVNLIRNSLEAATAGSDAKVSVAARLVAEEVVIEVEDNGPGIPEDSTDKVFESFYTTKAFGTGLGLPIARSLTAALGGQLVLRACPRGGTQAEVRLPVAGAEQVSEVKV